MPFCPDCAAELNKTHQFCTSCGSAVTGAQQPEAQTHLVGGSVLEKEAAIQQALKSIDEVNQFISRREIKELPALLWEDELRQVSNHFRQTQQTRHGS